MAYNDLAAAVDRLRPDTEPSSNRALSIKGPRTNSRIVAAGVAGAPMVLSDGDNAVALAQQWTIHLLTDRADLGRLDPEPFEYPRAVILNDGPESTSGFG